MESLEPLLDAALSPGAFFVPPPGVLRIERIDVRTGADSRQVFVDRPDLRGGRPLIRIDHDVPGKQLKICRNVPMRGDGWLNETVATIPLDRVVAPDAIAGLLGRSIGFALAGSSRLGITSIETPHPAYSLGMVAYLPEGDRSLAGRARALEARLRCGAAVAAADDDLPAVLRMLFNQLALSPYTSLVNNLVAFLRTLDPAVALDALGYMLRHLARHLNAFDLVRFHNMGANYPDALMLDAVLRAFIALAEGRDLSSLQRRALRQGWLARKRCEGLRVPDRPVSPGENARDVPGGGEPVPAAQITEPAARTRRLFADELAEVMLTDAARSVLNSSAADLCDPAELRELGAATFLDRPLGACKREGEPDRTTLLSFEAFSVRLALSRVGELVSAGFIDAAPADRLARSLRAQRQAGWPVGRLAGHARRGVVSLEDAKKVALDFAFTRTTRSSLDEFLARYDFSALNAARPDAYQWLRRGRDVLLIRSARGALSAVDEHGRTVMTFAQAEPARFIECGGVEYAEDLHAVIADAPTIPLPPRLVE